MNIRKMKCAIGLHNYGKFEVKEFIQQWAWEKEGSRVIRQVRQCKDCGFTQIKRI